MVAAAAGVFLFLALACVLQPDSETKFLGVPLAAVGAFLAVVGVARVRTRVVATADGLRRSPRFPNGFMLAWAEVEYWRVMRIERPRGDHHLTIIAAHFVLANGRRPVQVAEEDVSRPGFDTFLREVRRHVGGRER